MRKNFKQSNLNRQCEEVSELCESHSNSQSAKGCFKQEAEDQFVGPQVLSTVVMKVSLLRDTKPCSSWKDVFRGTCCFHFKFQRTSSGREHDESN
jgi:hypothetical protein